MTYVKYIDYSGLHKGLLMFFSSNGIEVEIGDCSVVAYKDVS